MKCKYRNKLDCFEKECNDPLCRINVLTENYFEEYAFREEGWYNDFQKTKLWKEAKEFLKEEKGDLRLTRTKLNKETKFYEFICDYCKQKVFSKEVLHHKVYDWINFFHVDHISFLHRDCHEKWHKEKDLPNWKNLPDKLYDMFIFIKDFPDADEIQISCWKCDTTFIGKPYQFLCKRCYSYLINQGIKPDWRDYLD